VSRVVLLFGLLLVAANVIVGQQGKTLLAALGISPLQGGIGSEAGKNPGTNFPTGSGTEAGKAAGSLPPPGQTTMPVPVTGPVP
jgi:hypothetical protein